MKMTELITLETIDQVFSRSKKNLSWKAKMLYLNCLTGWFRDKLATEQNAMEFELFRVAIPNYEKWHPQFMELHAASMIRLSAERLIFTNLWGQYIDRSKLETHNHLTPLEKNEQLFAQLKSSKNITDVIGLQQKIAPEQVAQLIETFIADQRATEQIYTDFNKLSKHFINWARKITTATPTISKGSPKMLGKS